MSRNDSGSTQSPTAETETSNRQFAQGGNPDYVQTTPQASNVPENRDVDDLTLMMLQAREGRA
ncbi:hypothetical protein QTL95_21280 [Rhizobium sp. S152]|uniref:hypothetical protein n=1 Tax=Rhizobium sp. S152 TaxID=3055038 RepID=UPI0025A9AFED|nr:hypothetical protein [Rhizobium sp. S152]MDM9628434.1 hypothetical protein [Rhizobium sp. S152]